MKELAEAHEHGIGYRMIQAGTDLDYAELKLPIGSNDLILVPVVVGSGGGGTSKILIGVGLVALSFLLPGAGLFGTTSIFNIGALTTAAGSATLATTLGTALSAIGASLILGGVAEMLSPQPVIPTLSGRGRMESTSTDGPQSVTRGTDGKQSYLYTGAANTIGVGATIPVAYGEVLIGSNLLSANVEIADESDPLRSSIKTPGPDTVLFGGEKLSFSDSKASGITARRINGGFPSSAAKFNNLNSTIGFAKGNIAPLGQINGQNNRGSAAAILELNIGLFDFVSGPGSTLVDGYITYKLYTETQTDGSDPTTGQSQATVQGLLLPGQTYRWLHTFENQEIDDQENVRFYIEIIDFVAAPQCAQLIVRSAGLL
jgi:predicted phage tail protein